MEVIQGRIETRAAVSPTNLFGHFNLPVVFRRFLNSHWTDFDETWYLRLFRKSVEKIQISLESDRLTVLYVKMFRHFWRYLAEFFLEWEMF
jgi:hypothetical protein